MPPHFTTCVSGQSLHNSLRQFPHWRVRRVPKIGGSQGFSTAPGAQCSLSLSTPCPPPRRFRPQPAMRTW